MRRTALFGDGATAKRSCADKTAHDLDTLSAIYRRRDLRDAVETSGILVQDIHLG
jgi:hypothetical protein